VTEGLMDYVFNFVGSFKRAFPRAEGQEPRASSTIFVTRLVSETLLLHLPAGMNVLARRGCVR